VKDCEPFQPAQDTSTSTNDTTHDCVKHELLAAVSIHCYSSGLH